MAKANSKLPEASHEDYSELQGELEENWEAFYNEWQNLDPTMVWDVNCYMHKEAMNEIYAFNFETMSQSIAPLSQSDSIEEDGSLSTYNSEYRQLLSSGSSITPSTPSSTRAGDYSSQYSPPTTTSTPLSPPDMMIRRTPVFQQYSCRYCDLNFDRRHKLNRHEKLHTKPVKCPIDDCTHRVAKARDMNRHIMAQHPEHNLARPLLALPSYKCPAAECGFSQRGFRRKDNLKRHMRNTHGEVSGAKRA